MAKLTVEKNWNMGSETRKELNTTEEYIGLPKYHNLFNSDTYFKEIGDEIADCLKTAAIGVNVRELTVSLTLKKDNKDHLEIVS